MKCYLLSSLGPMVLLIGLGSTIAAQSPSDDGITNRTGKISGQVVNESGQPLANAMVSVRPFGPGQGRTATTDSEGSFQVNGLEPAAYIISASLVTYVAVPRDPDVNPIGYYHLGDSVRLEMMKGGVITGTVTRSAGEPVVVVRVRAYMVRDYKGQPARYGAPFSEQTTDDRGVYRIYGLSPGTYVVAAGGGNANDYYYVNAYGTDAPTYAPSSTRDTATEIYVRPGEEATNVDIRYRGEPGHAVSGIASSMVALDQPTGFNVILSSSFNGTSQSSYTSFQPPGSRGFSFSGVADGDYDVIAQAYLPEAQWVVSEPRRIRVKGADITGLELTTKPFGSISGRIAMEESTAPECKGKRRPLFGEIVVGPYHNEKSAPKDQPQFVWGLGGPTLPDKQGAFTMRNLAPGEYRFSVRPEAKYWYLKSISFPLSASTSAKAMPANPPFDAARNWTTLKPGGRLSGLTITLAEGAASLHGQIDLAEGQRLPPKLFVYLVPAESDKAEDVLRFFGSLVLPDGSFALNNLPPGRYWAIAQAAGESDLNILTKLRLPDEADARAKLRRNAEAGKIEAALKPCQNVTDYRMPFKGSN